MEEKTTIQCIAVIPDGNRRWARAKGLSGLEGHRKGYEKAKEVADWAFDKGIKTLLIYAFSTENWHRPPEEVQYLMRMLTWVLEYEVDDWHRRGVRIRVIGDHTVLSQNLQELILKAEEKTKENKRGTIGILLSYGGRAEIIAAAKKAVAAGAVTDDISEENFSRYLWTDQIPDPDIVIRTSGVMRLSNFLTWQTAYSELFFTETLWPDFTKEEFHSILEDYGERERRFGK